MKETSIYLALCILGVIIPWASLLLFLGEEHPSISLFFSYIFNNNVSTSVASDLLISALIFFVCVFIEGNRLKMKRLWIYIPATLMVGLSFGLPLFLYFRAKHIEGTI